MTRRRSKKNPVIDHFGSTNPKGMASYFFGDAKHIHYPSTVRADISKQDYCVVPRYWYIDCDFECPKCGLEFTWTAREQRVWFEKYRFWIEASPRFCKACRAAEKRLLELRKEYDLIVAEARRREGAEERVRVIQIVHELQAALSQLPQKMLDTAQAFQQQRGEVLGKNDSIRPKS